MTKVLCFAAVLLCLLSSGCVSLFSEIHNETHHHHRNGTCGDELEDRINELEERLEELLEGREFDEEREEEEEHEKE
ncbi:MAG: hypothetical protein NE328_20455 [Lentisphaeraceae bacterium]|nr:hypothetical protein [Lentisphaeraceae bacterium]